MPSEAMEAVDALASVVDVYDLASEIGKEFERLIDAHGADSLTNMMPKVRFLNDSTSGHFNCDTDEYNRIAKYYAHRVPNRKNTHNMHIPQRLQI
jgi:JNK_SAPK-associated protein-1